eukprot:TRINITY_DN22306_c0_g1_i2.p1 TRINITY_DN22306_c0_g1~~TRINITY_DN22306_c0_g1_i2.p1  ORF type:complete len:258 (-),score=33.43 TRINITY_DN22306_c0_g1_i2:2-775(-)
MERCLSRRRLLALLAALGFTCHTGTAPGFSCPPSRQPRLEALAAESGRWTFSSSSSQLRQPPAASTLSLAATTQQEGEDGAVLQVLKKIDSKTKWFVTVAQTSALLMRRDVVSPFMIIGAICAAFVTSVVKKVIGHERPSGSPFNDPGMPSSHALVSTFLAVAWCTQTTCAAVQATVVGLAFVISSLRVIGGNHTLAQVLVGATLGAPMGYGWMRLAGEVLPSFGRGGGFAIYSVYIALSVAFIRRSLLKRKIGAKD